MRETNDIGLETSRVLAEQNWHGNRAYWHGSYSTSVSGMTPFVLSKTGSPGKRHPETYFSAHFGYSLAYSLGIDDFHLLGHVKSAGDLTGSGSMTIPLSEKASSYIAETVIEIKITKRCRVYHWIVLLSVKPDTQLFHAMDSRDARALYTVMQNSPNQNLRNFAGRHTLDSFLKATEPLKKQDWLDGIKQNFPFTRTELLEAVRNYKVNGSHSWDGFVNTEKDSYPSIGVFDERMKESSLVGPLYQVSHFHAPGKHELRIRRFEGSVNASVPSVSPPNS